eukprot:5158105-Amphidinium_carterae.3
MLENLQDQIHLLTWAVGVWENPCQLCYSAAIASVVSQFWQLEEGDDAAASRTTRSLRWVHPLTISA